MNSFHPDILGKLHIDEVELLSIKLIELCRGRQEHFYTQAPQVLKALSDLAMVESTESSNRLEGIVTSHDRLEALVLQSTRPCNRDEEEIAGYRDALAAIHQDPQALNFDEKGILRLHQLIYRDPAEPAGAWKKKDNVILERNAASQAFIRFRPTAAKEPLTAMAGSPAC